MATNSEKLARSRRAKSGDSWQSSGG
ncbi:hypothetical protein A2U01_0106568, partial [Trifolium medium]|nr:hypothetical protein [Trifolium medium]